MPIEGIYATSYELTIIMFILSVTVDEIFMF